MKNGGIAMMNGDRRQKTNDGGYLGGQAYRQRNPSERVEAD